jgi:PHD/YefM family antitoxin component YafN of YafNO toxin-antitoxin module
MNAVLISEGWYRYMQMERTTDTLTVTQHGDKGRLVNASDSAHLIRPAMCHVITWTIYADMLQ